MCLSHIHYFELIAPCEALAIKKFHYFDVDLLKIICGGGDFLIIFAIDCNPKSVFVLFYFYNLTIYFFGNEKISGIAVCPRGVGFHRYRPRAKVGRKEQSPLRRHNEHEPRRGVRTGGEVDVRSLGQLQPVDFLR